MALFFTESMCCLGIDLEGEREGKTMMAVVTTENTRESTSLATLWG